MLSEITWALIIARSIGKRRELQCAVMESGARWIWVEGNAVGVGN